MLYDLLADAKILIVDDFAQFRGTIKTMLFKLGAKTIDQAGNAVQAMNLCLETDYDIIFCDYNMGDGQDGQQFLEELHQRHMLLKGSLFLMVTAESTSAQVMGAIEYRPDAYLTKPFTNDQLGQRLTRLLERNQHLKPLHQAINANDTTLALKLADALIEKKPNLRFSCLRLKSEILEQQNRHEELMQLYRQVIQEQSLLWAELGVGKVLFAQGDYKGALAHFQTMLDNFARQVSIFDWIARCQQELGMQAEAEETLKEAIEISPKSVRRQSTLGEIAQSLDHHELAHHAFQKTIEEGRHSCLQQPEHFRFYFENTRELAAGLSGREQSRLLATTEAIAKRMERKYADEPTALASNLSALAKVFTAADKTSQADTFLRHLKKTLDNPECRISQQEFKNIQQDLDQISEQMPDSDQVKALGSRLSGVKEEIAQEQVRDKSARTVNREGLNLANRKDPAGALEKFREAIRLMPHNPDYKLNAAQIILTSKEISAQPETIMEARQYMDTINLKHTGQRWRLYRKLREYLPDE